MNPVSLFIPAHNEADYIGDCLAAVLGSDLDDNIDLTIAVVANACTDKTAQIAVAFDGQARTRGWRLQVIETAIPGKLSALNLGEEQIGGDIRIYLDADVIVSPRLLGKLVAELSTDAARYASGSPEVIAPESQLIKRYARFWARLPFVSQGVPGFGIFAVNAAGRSRWERFPNIISDDTFVRLHFSETERVRVSASYRWPMVNGFRNLVRVRRRQDIGVAEIAARFPDLPRNDTKSRPAFRFLLRRIASDPLGFVAYGFVSLAVRLPVFKSSNRWARGR